ncbi:hypothetical protein AVDCRST_MAG81-118 [uncultured Synechococcales cyanobacterium]|uniref:Uncharacterized protein n=1 Tax=uncultured Synechococcales cyanobacterium TaxID=1936017 RepID=A0A6J4UM78_9CYAN|nr:hypothetical protein AVDCRST_MAG81-118 [uncultured Synechococcales cyanobacterium]
MLASGKAELSTLLVSAKCNGTSFKNFELEQLRVAKTKIKSTRIGEKKV